MPAQTIRQARRQVDFSRQLAEKGWYHSFELPDGSRIDGCISLEALRERYARFPLPPDLRGRRVLDIGAWDGWFSFEAERRGAAVTALDCVDVPGFRQVQRKLGSKVDYRILDLYELPPAGLGKFDFVLFLGVLYHLKHPLLGLEIVCRLTGEIALVDSFVTDGDTWAERVEEIPSLEFYETDELGGHLDNWYGPSVACLLALCRAAGFARVELLHAQGNNATVACYRRWEPPAAGASGRGPELSAAVNHADCGINFTAKRDQYITCWFTFKQEVIVRTDLLLEVDGLGAPPLYLRREKDSRWMANFRLPPGLEPGWKEVRLRLAGTVFGNSLRIAVDVPLQAEALRIAGACDGYTWESNEVQVSDRGVLSLWVAGLGENCDRHNVHVHLGAARLAVDYIGEPRDGLRQINAVVRGDLEPGEYPLRLSFGPASTEHAAAVRVGLVR
jgi:tRNA (mo5U34)-methyltransferase